MLRNGAPSGCWVTWHPDGSRRIACAIDGGQPGGAFVAGRAGGEMLARGTVRSGELIEATEFTGDESAELPRAPLPRVPPSGGDWSAPDVVDDESAQRVVATWLGELASPMDPDATKPETPTEVVAEPTPAQVEEVEELANLEATFQPSFTAREIEELDGYVKLYSEGPDKEAHIPAQVRAARAHRWQDRGTATHRPRRSAAGRHQVHIHRRRGRRHRAVPRARSGC